MKIVVQYFLSLVHVQCLYVLLLMLSCPSMSHCKFFCPVFMAVNLCPFADMFRSMPTSVYAFMFVFFSVFLSFIKCIEPSVKYWSAQYKFTVLFYYLRCMTKWSTSHIIFCRFCRFQRAHDIAIALSILRGRGYKWDSEFLFPSWIKPFHSS